MEVKSSNTKYNKMIDELINKLIITLAIPTVISMLVTSIYNMADTYFVTKLGDTEAGAVGIVFSLMAIIQAVGFTIGMGSGSLISRLLGAKKDNEANQVASSGFFFAMFLGIIVAFTGIIGLTPLMKILGSTKTILPYSKEYGKYILLATPVMVSSFVLNNILRAEGKAKFSMIGLTTGGILNIILDPIFIFALDMKITGAAVATVISQLISFCILLSCFIEKKSTTNISIKSISKKISTYFSIVKNGLPSFCRQGLSSVSTVLLNRNAGIYGGDVAIAAISIVGKIFMVIFSILIGVGQGYQPVVGYNYGARRLDRVKESFWFTLKTGLGLMIGFTIIGYVFAPNIISVFSKDKTTGVIEIGTKAFRAQCLAMPILPVGVVCNMTFQAIGKSILATITSAARQGIFFIPLIILLPKIYELNGVIATQAIADGLTFIFILPFLYRFLKRLNMEMKEEKMSYGKFSI